MNPPSIWDDNDPVRTRRRVTKMQQELKTSVEAGDWRAVRSLRGRIYSSHDAALVAVARVTQENRGKGTAGVDGRANLSVSERLELAEAIRGRHEADPYVRRLMPKRGGGVRPLAIPTMIDRAHQALHKLYLEPELQVRLHPLVFGSLHGRGMYPAIGAVARFMAQGPMYAAVGDIRDFFGNVRWEAVFSNLAIGRGLRTKLEAMISAPVVDGSRVIDPEKGVPQGAVIAPVLGHFTLIGLHQEIASMFPSERRPLIVVYMDDVVVLAREPKDAAVAIFGVAEWLAQRGYDLNMAKNEEDRAKNDIVRSTIAGLREQGHGGFNFLGVHFEQFPVDPEAEAAVEAYEQGHVDRDGRGRPLPRPQSRGWITELSADPRRRGVDFDYTRKSLSIKKLREHTKGFATVRTKSTGYY
jgi:RNA-directed DNA polymerase